MKAFLKNTKHIYDKIGILLPNFKIIRYFFTDLFMKQYDIAV